MSGMRTRAIAGLLLGLSACATVSDGTSRAVAPPSTDSLTALASQQPSPEWSVALKPYLWIPSVDSTIQIGSVPPAPSDGDAADIFRHLDFGFMLGVDVCRADSPWSFSVDSLYAHFNNDDQSVDTELAIGMFETDVAYRVGDGHAKIDALVGARVFYVDVGVDPPGAIDASANTNVIDPVLGARCSVPLAERWNFSLRGDVGGFATGTSWQALGDISYRMSEGSSISLGYRYFDIAIDHDHIDVDATLRGPTLGLTFTL